MYNPDVFTIQTKKLSRKKFSPSEDEKLRFLFKAYGTDWEAIGLRMTEMNGRQCRDRWIGFLAPEATPRAWTKEEDMLISRERLAVGPKWEIIATKLKGRTATMVKNRFAAIKRREQINSRFPKRKRIVSKPESIYSLSNISSES